MSTQHGRTSTAAPSWLEVRGVSVSCVAYFRIPIYVDNRRPVAFWIEFCASESLAWVDFFLIWCNSSCNQNCSVDLPSTHHSLFPPKMPRGSQTVEYDTPDSKSGIPNVIQ